MISFRPAGSQPAAGAPAAELIKPGWKSSEFALQVGVLLFAAWAGWYVLTSDVDLERFLTVVGTVAASAGYYTSQRTSLKKTAQAEGVK